MTNKSHSIGHYATLFDQPGRKSRAPRWTGSSPMGDNFDP